VIVDGLGADEGQVADVGPRVESDQGTAQKNDDNEDEGLQRILLVLASERTVEYGVFGVGLLFFLIRYSKHFRFQRLKGGEEDEKDIP